MSLIRHHKLELKIAELLEMWGLIGLIELKRVRRLERTYGSRYSRTARGRRVDRANWIAKARRKITNLLLIIN